MVPVWSQAYNKHWMYLSTDKIKVNILIIGKVGHFLSPKIHPIYLKINLLNEQF